MKIAIAQMFRGSRGNGNCIKSDERLNELTDAEDACEERLAELLNNNPEAQEAFEVYKRAYEEKTAHEAYLFYEEGFRFGVLLGLDVSDEENTKF